MSAKPAAAPAAKVEDKKVDAAAPKKEEPKAAAAGGHGGHGGHGGVGKDGKRASGRALVAASGTAGLTELFIFHPIDTIAKRLMSNTTKVFVPGQPWAKTSETLGKVLLKNAAGKSLSVKFFSLFPGLGFAAAYKISQRIYKFGGQPIVNEYVTKNIGDSIKKTFGEKQGKPLTNAIAGMFIGIGEIVILPFDVLKIKKQTNPEAFKGRGIMDIVLKENFKLWNGGVTTAVRNAFGSFALFGAAVATKEYVFGLKNYNDATVFQNTAASTAGAVASIIISNPLDVIKTRIQNKNFGSGEGALQVLGKMIKNEGFSAFFKGVVPKTGIVGPKLIFSFTVAQQLTSVYSKMGL